MEAAITESQTEWQRTMSQMSEQDKMPGQKLIEGEIGTIYLKEFRVMIEKIFQDLRKEWRHRLRRYKKCSTKT